MPNQPTEEDLNILAQPVVRQTLGQPDPFRLRYRQQLIEIIGEVVRQKLIGQDIPVFIEHWSKENLPQEDRPRFVEVVEVELFALHEGNCARFRLRHSEFLDWFDLFKHSVRKYERKPGLHPGAFVISDDFDEPLPDSFWMDKA
jgi:hypothetical protein